MYMHIFVFQRLLVTHPSPTSIPNFWYIYLHIAPCLLCHSYNSVLSCYLKHSLCYFDILWFLFLSSTTLIFHSRLLAHFQGFFPQITLLSTYRFNKHVGKPKLNLVSHVHIPRIVLNNFTWPQFLKAFIKGYPYRGLICKGLVFLGNGKHERFA